MYFLLEKNTFPMNTFVYRRGLRNLESFDLRRFQLIDFARNFRKIFRWIHPKLTNFTPKPQVDTFENLFLETNKPPPTNLLSLLEPKKTWFGSCFCYHQKHLNEGIKARKKTRNLTSRYPKKRISDRFLDVFFQVTWVETSPCRFPHWT